MDSSLVAQVVDFLLEPWSGAAVHHIPAAWAWHGRLMVLAGAVLFPVGVMLARYYKVTRRQNWPEELDNRFWWHGHRLTQYLGIGLMTGAVAVVWTDCFDGGIAEWPCRQGPLTQHALAGLAALAAGWLQNAISVVGSPWHRGSRRRKVTFHAGRQAGCGPNNTLRREARTPIVPGGRRELLSVALR